MSLRYLKNLYFKVFLKKENYNAYEMKGLSNFLNNRMNTLNLDYERSVAPPEYYDTDLEDYWTNPSNS